MKMINIYLTKESKEILIPCLIKDGKNTYISALTPDLMLKKIQKLGADKVKLAKRAERLEFLGILAVCACCLLYFKNRKLQLRVIELIDQVDDLELEKALNADEEVRKWEEAKHMDI